MVAVPPKKNLMSAHAALSKSSREAELEAEVARLKSKNSRLGKAMLSLVSHIERKLPFLNTKSPTLVTNTGDTRPVDRQKARRAETSENWKPAVLVQEKTGDALLKKRPRPLTSRQPSDIQAVQTEAIIFGDAAPELTPGEVDILKSPTQVRQDAEEAKQPTAARTGDGRENTVAREARKTSAQQAADAYEAVSLVSTPVPEDISDDETTDAEAPYRIAMRKRVNRLRW